MTDVTRQLGCWIAGALLLVSGPSWSATIPVCAPELANGDPNTLLDAIVVGRALVRDAAARLGGADRIETIRRLRQVTVGSVFNGLQAYDPPHIDSPDTKRLFNRGWEFD